ncbi:hypothetical protein [Caldisericum sp. AR60]|uniref:hypothetical protein n=1 Tax=Caldisericum sp. AR60 TaxID=3397852 RepID=UPI0039FC43FA
MKNNIEIFIITVLIVMASLSFSGCTKNKYSENPELLPSLKLPSYGGFIPHDFGVQLGADVSNPPDEMLVYKVEPIEVDEKKLCAMSSIDINAISSEDENTVIRKQSGNTLTIYKKTGFFEFSTQNLYDYTPGKEVPGDEECLALAKSFVDKYKLLPELYQYRTSISNITYHPSFNEEIIIDKTITFYPAIVNKEIIGPKFGLIIGDKGKVEGLVSTLYTLTPIGNYTLKSTDEVVKQLKNNEVTAWKVELENADAEKIIIDKIETEYYGDIGTTLESGGEFVQPVYKLSGEILYKNGDKGKFEAFVPAVSSQFIQH